jgi:hypothetical protein
MAAGTKKNRRRKAPSRQSRSSKRDHYERTILRPAERLLDVLASANATKVAAR